MLLADRSLSYLMHPSTVCLWQHLVDKNGYHGPTNRNIHTMGWLLKRGDTKKGKQRVTDDGVVKKGDESRSRSYHLYLTN